MSSIYKDTKSPFYYADIWIQGRKFSRSTGATSKSEAKRRANEIEAQLRKDIDKARVSEESLALDHVAGRYMRDVGNYHAGEGASITAIKIAFLIKFFGEHKLMSDIKNDDVFKLRNWRRAHHVGEWRRNADGEWVHRKPGEDAKLISSYTVNDTVEQLKKLFTYLKNTGIKLDNAPNFSNLWLDEPKARPRALSEKERKGLNQAINIRPDAEPLIMFSRMVGKRQNECITLEWSHVKWDHGKIERRGKGDAPVEVRITPAIRALLMPLIGHHPKFVFTFVAQRTVKNRMIRGKVYNYIKGQRYPFTKDGLRRIWTSIREEAGIPIAGDDRFRWHDIRHDFAINFLKKNPTAYGMKALQKALDHADFETTANTYAAVLETEVSDTVEAQAQDLLRERMAAHGERQPPEGTPELQAEGGLSK
jgi:integrase